MHLQVVVGEFLPFLKLTVLFGRVYMSGPFAEVFQTLSVRLNFTYTLHEVKDNTWGINGPNGWTGMLGMVSRNEVDMAIGPFTMTYDRWSSFKLSDPLYADSIKILVPATEWKMTLFSVVTVFSASVWISIFVSLFSLSLMMTIIEKYSLGDASFTQRFFNILWLSLRTLLQKGRAQPGHYLQTFLSVLWLFSALLVALMFGCVMLTRLFVRKVHKIDSLDDLIASPDIQPILENDSSLFGIFKKSQLEAYSTIFQRATSNPEIGIQTYASMGTTGLDHVMSGAAAMITDGIGLKGFMAQRYRKGQPCNFWLAKETLLTSWKVIAFSNNFSDEWIRKINDELRHSLESGWLQARMRAEYQEYEQCISKGNNEFSSLGLDHTRGIFLIWSLGCGMAIVVFLIERYKGSRIEYFGHKRKDIKFVMCKNTDFCTSVKIFKRRTDSRE